MAKRNAKKYYLKKIENAEYILSLDLTELRKELIKRTFTCADLVTVYAQRCNIIILYNYKAPQLVENCV